MKKWMLVYDTYCRAVQKMYAVVSPYLDYNLICSTEEDSNFNIIKLSVQPDTEGLTVNVSENDGENQRIEITGQDEIYLLYGVVDFKNIYLPYAEDAGQHNPVYYFHPLFSQPFKPYKYTAKAMIKERGIWLWGYTVYDYRRFIDNMTELKLNTLIIWNDYLPLNISDVISYAHINGIKIYLGYSWGWDDQQCDKLEELVAEPSISRISEDIIREYELKYANLNCDGIYFQSFTEHTIDTVNGVVIAEAVVDLVNRTAARLLEKHPDIKLLFGLHAGSVINRLDVIKTVNPKVSVIWEDAGAFPYNYSPARVEDFDQTLVLNNQLQNLRDSGGFGAVLKGNICLDWSRFEHLRGNYIMGVAEKEYINQRTERQKKILRYTQAYWIKNAEYALRLIQELREDAIITCLVEDGMFENLINYPIALCAQMLWDSNRSVDDILCQTALMPCVDFV